MTDRPLYDAITSARTPEELLSRTGRLGFAEVPALWRLYAEHVPAHLLSDAGVQQMLMRAGAEVMGVTVGRADCPPKARPPLLAYAAQRLRATRHRTEPCLLVDLLRRAVQSGECPERIQGHLRGSLSCGGGPGSPAEGAAQALLAAQEVQLEVLVLIALRAPSQAPAALTHPACPPAAWRRVAELLTDQDTRTLEALLSVPCTTDDPETWAGLSRPGVLPILRGALLRAVRDGEIRLMARLAEVAPMVAATLLIACPELGAGLTAEALSPFFHDADPEVRSAAIRALAHLDGEANSATSASPVPSTRGRAP